MTLARFLSWCCSYQGQGGLLHRKNWKRRFFVLYSVPQGSVLVYYDKKSVNGDDILGYIDIRNVTEVKQSAKVRPVPFPCARACFTGHDSTIPRSSTRRSGRAWSW